MAVGDRVDVAPLGEIPTKFRRPAVLPQPAVLKHATAFLSHIGMNSTMEVLLYQVPLVAFPQPQLSSCQCHDLGARWARSFLCCPGPWAGGLSRCAAPPDASLVGVWLDRSAPRARLTRAHPSLGAHHEACQSRIGQCS
jgi:hypothetical protein